MISLIVSPSLSTHRRFIFGFTPSEMRKLVPPRGLVDNWCPNEENSVIMRPSHAKASTWSSCVPLGNLRSSATRGLWWRLGKNTMPCCIRPCIARALASLSLRPVTEVFDIHLVKTALADAAQEGTESHLDMPLQYPPWSASIQRIDLKYAQQSRSHQSVPLTTSMTNNWSYSSTPTTMPTE